MLARVFPRRTNATPIDDYAFIGEPPMYLPDDIGEVHVSCTFTWDMPRSEQLRKEWGMYYDNVKLGGPAYGNRGDEFNTGKYLKDGCVITSRGCVNKCSFCFVPKREGDLRLLEIKDGYNVMDNNLLACPRWHIEAVMEMLSKQKHRAIFTGGIDTRMITKWWCDMAVAIKPKSIYFAYDTPSQSKQLEAAVDMMRGSGMTDKSHQLACYVLVGYNDDTIAEAEKRLEWVASLGVRPYAMYYRSPGSNANKPKEWAKLVRLWIRPHIVYTTMKKS